MNSNADEPRGKAEGSTPPLAPDLCLSSVFRIRDLDQLERIYLGEETGFLYARDGHPNAARLARVLAAREGSEAALVVSSGMAAVATVMLELARPGEPIVVAKDVYGKTRQLVAERLAPLGVDARFVDPFDLQAVDAALVGAKLLWVETLSNPLLRAAPIDRLSDLARRRGALLAVDATFTPAPILRPIDLGADIVVHSLTKILSGHSDVTLGVLLSSTERVERMAKAAATFGFHAAAMDCWLAERSLACANLRIERSCHSAGILADGLASARGVASVAYPLRVDHPDRSWAAAKAPLGGHMVTIEVGGGRDGVNRLFGRLRRVPFSPSLGDVRTTVSHPWSTSHRGLAEGERRELGITPGHVRISVGIDDPREVLEDFRQALD